MSGYFSRLAQRSGALPPPASRPVTPADAVGLVEQESVLEVAPSSPPDVSAPARASAPDEMPKALPMPLMTAVASSTPLSASPASQASIRKERISASPAQGLAPMTMTTPRMMGDGSAGRKEPKKSDDAAVLPSAPIRRAVDTGQAENTLPRSLAVAKDGSNAAPTSAGSQRDDGQIERSTTISSPLQRASSREVPTKAANAEPLSPSEPREHPWAKVAERSPVAVERIEKHARMPVSSRRAPEGTSMATQNIEVRIGAVRLEIHGQPTPTPAPAPASAAPPAERPRFAPRRYFLRS